MEMVSAEYKGIKVSVKEGDIVQEEADAIVNPANSLMVMGGGVAGAIRRAGGEAIEKEAMAKAPVPVGEAVATSAGGLRAKYVIHAPTVPEPGVRSSPGAVKEATKAALRVAEGLKIKSIAFPGMGTGVGGVPAGEAARAMAEAIREHADSAPSGIREIRLIAREGELLKAFEMALAERLRD